MMPKLSSLTPEDKIARKRRSFRQLVFAVIISLMAGTLDEPWCFIQFGAALIMLWMAYKNAK